MQNILKITGCQVLKFNQTYVENRHVFSLEGVYDTG
jgi:hypothetical protein